jgi:hypothetical protein
MRVAFICYWHIDEVKEIFSGRRLAGGLVALPAHVEDEDGVSY